MSEEPEQDVAEDSTDDNKRRFQEALARKQHRAGVSKAGHGPDRQHLPSSNDKRRQQFRRKSGG